MTKITLEKVTLRWTGIVYYAVCVDYATITATDDLKEAQQKYDSLKKELETNPPSKKESDFITEVLKSEEI
jgi:hypothetical protein